MHSLVKAAWCLGKKRLVIRYFRRLPQLFGEASLTITHRLFFWWLSPILVGLILAAPIVRYSSSIGLGVKMRKMGLFLCPSEVENDDTLAALRVHQQEIGLPKDEHADFSVPALPNEYPTVMPFKALRHPQVKKRKQVRIAQQRIKAKLFAKR